MPTAIVVGSGPNGLAAAVELAAAGVDVTVIEGADEVGGGMRSAELTLPGLVHDWCSAIHPFGAASPAFRRHDLGEHGLRWRQPTTGFAHPFDDGTAALEGATLEATARGLGEDEGRWRALLRPLVAHVDDLVEEVMQPVLHVPRHPVTLVRFGVRALLPATVLGRVLRTEHARGLFAGVAAHLIHRLDQPLSSATGLMLLAVGQAYGWPVAEGGSQAIASALVGRLESLGGRVETGRWVRSLDELDRSDAVLFDTSPGALADIAGAALHPREAAGLRRWRHGPAAFKVDLAVEGGVPWTAEGVAGAGTVHLGGTLDEIAAAEADVVAGRLPLRPFTLVGQQSVADPSRARDGVHPVWAYCHVPHGWRGDATELVLAQLARFAPGVRDRVLATAVAGPAELAAHNPNYVGGDIANGENDMRQLLLRPRPTTSPYRTSAPGVYLCSSATPPGAGVHGMAGFHAAQAALADLRHVA